MSFRVRSFAACTAIRQWRHRPAVGHCVISRQAASTSAGSAHTSHSGVAESVLALHSRSTNRRTSTVANTSAVEWRNPRAAATPVTENAANTDPSAVPLPDLLQWTDEVGIDRADGVVIRTDPVTGRRGLFATRPIASGTPVLAVPFRACLGPVSFPPEIAQSFFNVPPPTFFFEHFDAFQQQQPDPNLVEPQTTPLECCHMWLACVVAAIHQKALLRQRGSGDQDDVASSSVSDSVPFEAFIKAFPTSTAPFEAGARHAWPSLANHERRDFMAIHEQHDAMVADLHELWMQWAGDALGIEPEGPDGINAAEDVVTGASALSSSTTAGKDTSMAPDEDLLFGDADGDPFLMQTGDGMGPAAVGPSTADDKCAVPQVEQSEAENPFAHIEPSTATLPQLQWAFRMVLSRAALMPALCEASAPEDVGTYLERIGTAAAEAAAAAGKSPEEAQLAAELLTTPVLVPLLDMVNHGPAPAHTDPDASPGRANCEVMTARRVVSEGEMDEVPSAKLATMVHRREEKREHQAQRQAEHAAIHGAQGSSATLPSKDSCGPSSTSDSDKVANEKGVIILMAVRDISPGQEILIEYDVTSDRPAALLRYGFVEGSNTSNRR